MGLSGAAPARGAGALRRLTTVGLVIAYTKSGDGLEVTRGQQGFSAGATLSSGVGTLTFPPQLSFLAGYGSTGEDGKSVRVHNVDLDAGTASFTVLSSSGAAEEPAANETIYLVLECGE